MSLFGCRCVSEDERGNRQITTKMASAAFRLAKNLEGLHKPPWRPGFNPPLRPAY